MLGPDKLMLIRHAEKQDDPPPFGITEEGERDKHSLTARGWQRAGALVSFFCRPTHRAIATPATIFASAPSDDPALPKGEARSLRPQETIGPLAAALGIVPNTGIPVGNEQALVDALRGCTGVTLVAWEHKHLPIIAAAFVAHPPVWPDERFDIVWVLDRRRDATYSFVVADQHLLAGDA